MRLHLCDCCEDALPAVATFTILISGFGTRRTRQQRTVPAIHACENCAGEIARVLGRIGMRRQALTLLQEVLERRC
jgi:hypothetical protein